jgi:phospholipase C
MTKLLFEHFVVLMLEKRSSDHRFGYLGVGEGLAGVSTTNYLKLFDKKTTPFNAGRGGDYTAIGQGPSHSLKETNMQLFGATNLPANMPADQATLGGFVASFATSQDRPQARTD